MPKPYKYDAAFNSAHKLRLYLIQNPDVVDILKKKKFWHPSDRNPLIDLCTNPLWAAKSHPESLSTDTCAEMAKVLLQEFEVNPDVFTHWDSNKNEGKPRKLIRFQCNDYDPRKEVERDRNYPTAFLASALNNFHGECRIFKMMLEAGVDSGQTIKVRHDLLNAVDYATQYGFAGGAGKMVKTAIKEHANKRATSDSAQGLLSLLQNAPNIKKQLSDAKKLAAAMDKIKAYYAEDMKDYRMEMESLKKREEELSKQIVKRKRDHVEEQAVLMGCKGFMAKKQIKAAETELEVLTSIKAFVRDNDTDEDSEDSGEEDSEDSDEEDSEDSDEEDMKEKADSDDCKDGNGEESEESKKTSVESKETSEESKETSEEFKETSEESNRDSVARSTNHGEAKVDEADQDGAIAAYFYIPWDQWDGANRSETSSTTGSEGFEKL